MMNIINNNFGRFISRNSDPNRNTMDATGMRIDTDLDNPRNFTIRVTFIVPDGQTESNDGIELVFVAMDCKDLLETVYSKEISASAVLTDCNNHSENINF